MTLSKHVGNS